MRRGPIRRLLVPSLVLALLSGGASFAQGVVQPGFDQVEVGGFGPGFGRTRAWGLGVADFTSDGVPDVVAGDFAGDVHLFEGAGDGSFVDRGIVVGMPFNDAFGLAVADFDRDGFQDFALATTSGSAVPDGTILLYLGNGDGSFQVTPGPSFSQLGLVVGDVGTDPVALAAGDVDGDGDPDLVAGERDVDGLGPDTADVVLLRNELEIQGGALTFAAEIVVSGQDRGFTPGPLPEEPPYFVPDDFREGYGLALGDMDGDGDNDLLVGDVADHLYVYRNAGNGSFAPIRYDNIPTGTRPFAFQRLYPVFSDQMPLVAGDLNGDGLADFATNVQSSASSPVPTEVHVWLNLGLDAAGDPDFVDGGVASAAGSGTNARGVAVGQANPLQDLALDLFFGNLETVPGEGGQIFALLADLTDSDGDGIIDDLDNAPLDFNPPVLDMNADGALNRFDQLDADADGVGDPADPDDDNDGVPDGVDLCPFTPDPSQQDLDGDGRGDACDPLNDTDSDGDGVNDGPFDPILAERAVQAKARWASRDTRFVIRIDALSRVFQNEFTQTMADAAILDPASWEVKKFENYNGIGDAPAAPGFQVPADLPGGKSTPITLVTIPKQLWNAFGDPDPIRWINDRNDNPNLEISQHGTYHNNNTPFGDWATQPDRSFFSCDECGFELATVFQYLRVGLRTLLGQYGVDPWIQQSGADPGSSPRIDWSDAVNPLISYAPPFNASDPTSRDAEARLGYRGFSASVFEENSPIFTPEGSRMEQFDAFGMFHASSDIEVDPEAPPDMSYREFLQSITQVGGLNTWLIEEVSWATRFCNDQERLTPCPEAPGGINRENNMVDPERWENWLTLLDHANEAGVVLTLGEVALARATDNCTLIPNPEQADSDADGTGDACDVNRIAILTLMPDGTVNVRAQAPVAVAILGSEALDVRNVQLASLRFGPEGATSVFPPRLEDVNGDGAIDLVTHYRMRDAGLEVGDTEACLSGVIGATPFDACDAIVTGPPFQAVGR